MYRTFASRITGDIPATLNFLSCCLILFLTESAMNVPKNGFMVTKTFPNCGGFKSSPPKAVTDSVSG